MNMRMKFLLAPALALISGAGLWGQATKVALINMQEAIANTADGKAKFDELSKKYGPKQQEFQKRSADIQAKEDQYKKTQNTLSDDARTSMEGDITRLKTRLQEDVDATQQDSQEDEQKTLQDMWGKLQPLINKYAQDNQIMLVFDVSSQPNNLVCCASAPDITKEVVAAYDKSNAGGAGSAPTASKPATSSAPPAARPPANSVPRPPAGTPAK
jgi:Skp family chaperone for outer membrane proteins